MKIDPQVWVVEAGPTGDLHNPEGAFQISSERLADELSQLVGALADVLGRVQEGGSGYRLDEVTFEAAFDGRVGLALVGRTGAARVVTLKFVRSSRDLLAKAQAGIKAVS